MLALNADLYAMTSFSLHFCILFYIVTPWQPTMWRAVAGSSGKQENIHQDLRRKDMRTQEKVEDLETSTMQIWRDERDSEWEQPIVN